MSVVGKSAHLGILRSKSRNKTEATHIEQNITKARRTAYSLLSAVFPGVNGLDQMTWKHDVYHYTKLIFNLFSHKTKQSGKTWAIPKNYTQTYPFTST